MPALATFSAPWILIDFMSEMILLNLLFSTFFFIEVLADKTLKRCLCIWYNESCDVMIELLKYQGLGLWRSPMEREND